MASADDADRQGLAGGPCSSGILAGGQHFEFRKAPAAIPGASKPSRIAEDVAALGESVPAAFQADLRAQKLIAADVTVPTA